MLRNWNICTMIIVYSKYSQNLDPLPRPLFKFLNPFSPPQLHIRDLPLIRVFPMKLILCFKRQLIFESLKGQILRKCRLNLSYTSRIPIQNGGGRGLGFEKSGLLIQLQDFFFKPNILKDTWGVRSSRCETVLWGPFYYCTITPRICFVTKMLGISVLPLSRVFALKTNKGFMYQEMQTKYFERMY